MPDLHRFRGREEARQPRYVGPIVWWDRTLGDELRDLTLHATEVKAHVAGTFPRYYRDRATGLPVAAAMCLIATLFGLYHLVLHAVGIAFSCALGAFLSCLLLIVDLLGTCADKAVAAFGKIFVIDQGR